MTDKIEFFNRNSGYYTIDELNNMFSGVADAINSKLSPGAQLSGELSFGGERAINGEDTLHMDAPITVEQAKEIVARKGGAQLEYWKGVYGDNPTAVVLGTTGDIDGVYTPLGFTWPYVLERKIRSARALSGTGGYYSVALSSVADPFASYGVAGSVGSEDSTTGAAFVCGVLTEVYRGVFGTRVATPCTGFDVFYPKGYNLGAFEVFVDDVLYGVVDEHDPSLLDPSSGSNVFSVRNLPAGNHNVFFKKIPSEQRALIEGVQFYEGDEKHGGNPGVHVVSGCNNGNLTSTFSSYEYSNPSLLQQALSAHETDLLILNTTSIDYFFGLDRETTKQGILSIIRSYRRARENGSVLILCPWEIPTLLVGSGQFSDWKEMLRQTAKESGSAFLDLSAVIGDLSDGTNIYHPAADTTYFFINPDGHDAVADAILGVIQP